MPKIIDITQLYQDYGIPIAQPGNKHYLSGWVNTHCPFCYGDNFHLGYNEKSGHMNCWKCGFHPVEKALSLVLNVPYSKIRSLLKAYNRKFGASDAKFDTIDDQPIRTYRPPNLTCLKTPHIKFLEKRRFDPQKLAEKYSLEAFGPIAEKGYAHRIYIPIFFNRRLVSWYARSISLTREDKYRPCPKEKESIPHKHMLYGLDNVPGSTCVVVEGVTDVWRLGEGAVATFGVDTMAGQRALLIKRFRRIFVLFDNDESGAGQMAGEKLCQMLSGSGRIVKQVFLEKGDPGDLSQSDAGKMMQELLR